MLSYIYVIFGKIHLQKRYVGNRDHSVSVCIRGGSSCAGKLKELRDMALDDGDVAYGYFAVAVNVSRSLAIRNKRELVDLVGHIVAVVVRES